MTNKGKTRDAVGILRRRYIADDAERKASVEVERVNAEVARLLYDMRKNAGLSQKELAQLVGTTQSAISRLEDADYDGHSLTMLNRIATALNQRLMVTMTAADPEIGTRFSPSRALNKSQISKAPDDLPAVYELLDKSGANIYTGIAKRGRVQDRLEEHLSSGQDSVPGASRFRIKQKASIEQARQEEIQIINKEKPKGNQQG